MKVIDNPEHFELRVDDGIIAVFDAMWNRLDNEDKPIRACVERNGWNYVTLEKIKEQYIEESSVLIVVFETFLNGAVYQYGNYLDDKWYQVGALDGFA